MPDHLRDTLQKALGDGYRVERELGGGGMSRVFVLARGDWLDGLRTMQRSEAADLTIAQKLSGPRMAVIGAWLGALDPAVADTTLQRGRQLPDAEKGAADRAEFRWLDGLLGVAQGDDARVRRVVHELSGDTSTYSRSAARSLGGLWAARTNADAGADSLRALSDESMERGGVLTPVEAVDRFVVARALRRRGTPEKAERYLMWTDALTTASRTVNTSAPLAPLVSYERGIAFDEAGAKVAAVRHLRYFVDRYDQPPEAHKPLVADAKKRLARLTGADVPK